MSSSIVACMWLVMFSRFCMLLSLFLSSMVASFSSVVILSIILFTCVWVSFR